MTGVSSADGVGSAPVSAPAGSVPIARGEPRVWSVGEWQVASDLNRITRGGETIVLEPKAMALLAYLAGRAGQVIGRDELLAAVWPGVVVGDNALTQAVAKLRKALGDTAREPAYIEAIAKRGYRLIAAVSVDIGASGPPTAPAPARPPQQPPREARRLAARVAIGIAATGLAVIAWLAAIGVRTHAPGTSTAPDGVSATGRAQAEASEASGIGAAAAGGLPTVVVQPFRSVAGDASQAALARALSADLVTDLSKVAGIRVVTSDDSAGAPRAGPRPAYRLGGTVQQGDERLRLNVLLTDATSGQAVWSTRLERQASDLFSAQDDLVKSILQALPVQLSEAETRRLAQRQTRSIVAWQTFVRAQAALLVRQRAMNEEARALYWEAIRHDPAFARAYAGVAMTHALEFQLGWARDPAAALARAAALAQTSAQMNPEMPEARWVLAFVHTQRREYDRALRELDDALRLNPSYADAYALKGGIETFAGRPAAAVPLLRQALRLNPDSGSLYFLLLGRAYYFLGDDEQARVNLNEALARNAQNVEARVYLAASSARAGDAAAAQWQVDEIRVLNPAFRVRTWLETYPLSDAKQREDLRSALRSLGID